MQSMLFVLEDGPSLYERSQSDTCVAFDTTHGTNHLGVNLGLFVLVTPLGTTGIVAAALIVRQNANTFEWLFTAFKECLGSAPRVMFTDQDGAMAVAAPTVWPGTLHFLCTFHISLNINKNVKPSFAYKEANKEWQRFVGSWWKICKKTHIDCATEKCFLQEWNDLKSVLQDFLTLHPDSDVRFQTAMDHLDRLFALRHKWASRFTMQHATYGMRSSQRCESANSAVKGMLPRSGKVLLLDVAKKIVEQRNDFKSRSIMSSLRMALQLQQSAVGVPTWIQQFQTQVTPY